jgi:hypothetical protein
LPEIQTPKGVISCGVLSAEYGACARPSLPFHELYDILDHLRLLAGSQPTLRSYGGHGGGNNRQTVGNAGRQGVRNDPTAK